MGRPIKKRYWLRGGGATAAIASTFSGVTLSINNGGSHYSKGATLSITAPDWVDGVQATASMTTNGSGSITAATIGNVGNGYIGVPTVTVVKPATVSISSSTANSGNGGLNTFTVANVTGISVGMLISGASTGFNGYVSAINGNIITSTVNNNGTWTNASNLTFSDNGSGATFNVGLTNAETDTGTIKTTAYLTTGSSAVNSAIIKQEASHRYLVENNQGRGQCKLTATDALSAGLMTILATDWAGSTYYVTKLTSRKALLVNRTGTSTGMITMVTDGLGYKTGIAKWTTTGAATGTTVVIQTN